jgi:DNA-binding transcriptional regulator YiaG
MTLMSTHSDLLSQPASSRHDRDETQLCFYLPTLTHLYDVANAALERDPSGRPQVTEGEGAHRTLSSTAADPEVIASTADAPALRALEQLRAWLNVSYEQLAQVTGLSVSVIHHWRRRHREHQPVRPRASSVERLWRVHAALRSVAEALDGNDPGYGVQLWARSTQNGASPLELLASGSVDEVERLAGSLLFDQTARPTESWRRLAPDVEIVPEPDETAVPIDYGEADFG